MTYLCNAASSTATESLTDLDEATKQQLQPPCEVIKLRYSMLSGKATEERCSNAAEWISHVRCTECHTRRAILECGDCHAHTGFDQCRECLALDVVITESSERL